MMFVDTHSHIYLPEFEGDIEKVIADAKAAGVNKIILPNVDAATVGPMRRLAASDPSLFSMAIGLHPTEDDDYSFVISELEANAADYCAIGEIGMDLYWDKTTEKSQKTKFDAQLACAEKLNLPAIIHCREAIPQTLEVLRAHKEVSAVFHCFGGTENDVKDIRKVGDYYFGIGGVVTFKNSGLREVLPEIRLERIVLETDAPYLAPVPFRGKRNQPAYIPLIANTIAEVLKVSVAEVAEVTTANAVKLFGI